MSDYCPISLIHSVAKIFSKLLANRLAPHLDGLVSKCQSAFIRKRCIQDNFLYVQNIVRQFHKTKTPALFLKLDIQKAFDTINWSYLVEYLQARGFGHRWHEWITILFSMASSRDLIDGEQGNCFDHKRGVRHGDPLSPMLFILAFDPLQRILDLASKQGVLTPLPLAAAKLRTSLYADDAAIFINPTRDDLQAVKQILNVFGAATGLTTNFEKSSIHPIHCENVDLPNILQPFSGYCKTFPCRYLGLQLHTRLLQKIHIQPLVEKIRQRLAGWKGQLLNRAGRLTLVSSVLFSMPIYHLTISPLAKWARKKIDKIWQSFLWKGEDNAHRGQCLVNWPTVSRPKDLRGLGVLNLEKFSRALRLRWLWQEWTDSSKPWEGLQVPCNKLDRLLFQASTTVTIGSGVKAKFWHHSRLDGEAPLNLALHLFELVRRKNKSVAQELTNLAWIQSLRRKITTTTQVEEFVSLWIRIQQVSLQQDVEDTLVWKWTPTAVTRSASYGGLEQRKNANFLFGCSSKISSSR